MKITLFLLAFFLSIFIFASCAPLIHHADPFYDLNGSDYPRGQIPLINPVRVKRDNFSSSWNLELLNALYIDIPKRQEQEVQEVYINSRVTELEKFAIKDGVIMVYSPYINAEADPYIQKIFFHWFVMIPGRNITKGFHTEDEFRQYIQTLGIQDPDWQTPDEAFKKFFESGGCLDWIPDCN